MADAVPNPTVFRVKNQSIPEMKNGSHKWKKYLSAAGLVLLLLLCAKSITAQQLDSGSYLHTKINKNYLSSYFTDADDFLLSPIRWNRRQWLTTSAVAGAGAGIYFYDAAIRDAFLKHHPEYLKEVDKYFLDPAGLGLWVIPVVGVMYFGGDERARGTSLAVVKAWTYSAGTAMTMKYAFQRARPSQRYPSDPRQWEGLFGSWEYTAFPSGHSTLAFAMATVFASEYKDVKWVPPLSYTLATLAALSRIQHGDHWPSDVLIGAALGYATGKFIHRTSKPSKPIKDIRFN
jgi:membrane-associated phospholipid phosphatase